MKQAFNEIAGILGAIVEFKDETNLELHLTDGTILTFVEQTNQIVHYYDLDDLDYATDYDFKSTDEFIKEFRIYGGF